MEPQQLVIILGDQLFPTAAADLDLGASTVVWMAEDRELCTHYRYHKHKLILFLSAMRSYADHLRETVTVTYSALDDITIDQSYTDRLGAFLDQHPQISSIRSYEIEDHFFADRIREFAEERSLAYETVQSAGYVTSREQFAAYNQSTRRPFMATFYQQQRKRLKVLVDEKNEPLHGQWSFDADNRKKLPKKYVIPEQPEHEWTAHTKAVIDLVNTHFAEHPGEASNFWLATTRQQALNQLEDFLEQRFTDFGPYEDAFEPEEAFLFHSILSPYINMGLITAAEVTERAVSYAQQNDTHYPSVEGFVRQVIGWREFIRGMYHEYSNDMLSTNFFNHQRKLTDDWWKGTTGILPVDHCIQRADRYGYLHHIERLMVMGNMMLLSEIHPDEVNRWFMEFFVDSADWVMVPNVYGMSQFADGGIFATKPYICGSNYWSKMSSYKKGADWSDIVDGLYWRFIDQKRDFMRKNPRLSMMVSMYDKMATDKRERLAKAANDWLERCTVVAE
ncbi:MAG: cryptochrome/photolyase family protein [Bacteroidota bacterium]